MIGYIQGKTVFSDGEMAILLTTSGVGYELRCSYFTEINKDVGFYISHITRETEDTLYACKNIEDKKSFELLMTVTGVGPRSAYALVSTLGTEGVVQAINFEDVKTLTTAPGIGKKTAQQILLSLKEKIKKHFINKAFTSDPEVEPQNLELMTYVDEELKPTDSKVMREAYQALESLGYKETQFLTTLKKNFSENISSEELIKITLRDI